MFTKPSWFIAVSISVLALAGTASSQWSMSGEVVDVIDGKTLRVMSHTGEIKVELQFIEVPEPGQIMYDTVKGHLRGLTRGKVVAYRPTRIGRDRTVGRVMLNNVDIGLQMLRDGAAWHIISRSEGQEVAEYALYESTQALARTEKIGIWSVPGMKTASQVRAEKSESIGRAQDARYPRAKPRSKPMPGVWGDINPSIGDVGALMNGYNAKSRMGYVGTSLMVVKEMDDSSGIRMMVDLTYHYKQGAEGRKGVYVLTIVSRSTTEHFLKNNNLFLTGDDKTIDLGKPKRTSSTDNGTVQEVLTYQLTRDVLERVANKDVVLTMGKRVFYPTGMKYLIINLLQVS